MGATSRFPIQVDEVKGPGADPSLNLGRLLALGVRLASRFPIQVDEVKDHATSVSVVLGQINASTSRLLSPPRDEAYQARSCTNHQLHRKC